MTTYKYHFSVRNDPVNMLFMIHEDNNWHIMEFIYMYLPRSPVVIIDPL